jgi:alkylation response protein AidB-like acyl-CoA dehydrogenase
MTEQTMVIPGEVEDVETFRQRARKWIAANLPRTKETAEESGEGGGMDFSDEAWLRARDLQKLIYKGGFAGICYPQEYGGLGLTPAHQKAFNEEVAGYEMPLLLNVPTFSIIGPAILELGTEEQKQEHLAAAIRGEEVLVQFLSEPRGGSDLAGVTTRATQDGDVFILNGSKIWSSGAYAADYGVCLTRTDWDAPKHRGLTMLLVKVHQPGVVVNRIRQVNGNNEFCQEFFDNVEIPLANVLGEINGGWSAASRLLNHERLAVGGGSPYISGGARGPRRAAPESKLKEMVKRTGQSKDARVRELVAESHVLDRVQGHLVDRVVAGMRMGELPPHAAAIMRLFSGESAVRRAEIGVEVAGPHAIAAGKGDGDLEFGVAFLSRQAACLGGGSTEMARNIISERILGMPREYAADRDVPFNQVRQGR